MQEDPSGITKFYPGLFSGEIWFSFYTKVAAGGTSVGHSWDPRDHLLRARKCLCGVTIQEWTVFVIHIIKGF